MKLSNKSLYAVRALFDMAYHGTGDPSKIDDIASRQQVPPRFLEQIFQDLKRAGIVASKRGPKGGYFLTREPETVTIGQVVVAMEGSTAADSFCRLVDESDEEALASVQLTASVWRELGQRIDEMLDSISIQDLVDRGEAAGLKREGYSEFIYVI